MLVTIFRSLAVIGGVLCLGVGVSAQTWEETYWSETHQNYYDEPINGFQVAESGPLYWWAVS